ncbi:MAG: hypothetical protein ABI904_04880 [Chloroflexota bacterium]
MSKRIFSLIGLVALMVLLTGVLSAAAPVPGTKFKLVQGLPSTMNVGDTYTVIVQVTSDQQFTSAQAMPDFQYAGKGVVAVQGGDRVGQNTAATLRVTFQAKGSTAKMPGGVVPVSVVVGVRFGAGTVVVQRYDFTVKVP